MNNITTPERAYIPGMFSFGIVCYRNWTYMKETIDSVLEQDYGKIQLIISDDGSDYFPIEQFENYIESNKRENLVEYIVRHSEKNEGTVRHLNRVLECMNGEYCMLMAADDTLDNSGVLSRFVDVFEREKNSCGIVMGQTALYDITMTQFLEYYVLPDTIDAINDPNGSERLCRALYLFPAIPTTSVSFHRWVKEKYTPFDTDYYLIEDYPFHIKLAEDNVKMCYENFVAARHRDGGISHGAVTALSKSKQLYIKDVIHARKIVLNKVLSLEETEMLVKFNRWQVASHEKMLLTTGTGIRGFIQYTMKYPQYAIMDICSHANERRLDKWWTLFLSFLVIYLCALECAEAAFNVFPFLPTEILYMIFSVISASISIFVGVVIFLELMLILMSRFHHFG